MAPLPLPQSSPSPSSTPQEQQQPKTLPGMKRGIAIGVAASVCIILIAMLAFFAIRHRKLAKAQLLALQQQQQKHLPPPWQEEKQCINEKSIPGCTTESMRPSPAPLVEADTRPIFELDANPTPELPTKDEGRKAQELDGSDSSNSNSNMHIFMGTDEKVPLGEAVERDAPRRLVPVLHISPPETVSRDNVALLGVSPAGTSPGVVSPLESVCFVGTPREARGWV